MKFNQKKIAAALGAGAMAVAGSGVAFAYWTGTGDGSGTADAASAPANQLVLTAAASDLVPSDTDYTIPVYAANSGVTTIAVSHLDTTGFSAGDACDAVSGASLTPNDPTAQVLVEPGTTAADEVEVGTLTLSFPNDPDTNQNDCKSAHWTFDLSAS